MEGLAEQLQKVMEGLISQGLDKQLLFEQAIITPSCGTGSMEPADAEKVFKMTRELSVHMKQINGF